MLPPYLCFRSAKDLSILISLMMEEEIPTGAYLLRMIPRSSVRSKLGVSYELFVASAFVRLLIGYMFLVNVWLSVVQSSQVLEMFYDMVRCRQIACGYSMHMLESNTDIS